MIRTEKLIKQYNGVTVLDLPALTIGEGESFGLVGNNGAGKTTFFSLVLDIITVTSGKVFSNGKAVEKSDQWQAYTGSYLDERFLIDYLTVEEYFRFVAGLYGLQSGEIEAFYDRFAAFFNDEIRDKNKYIRDFSKGNQKKIGIAAALMAEPRLVILDEPFPHLDPTSVNRLKKILSDLQQKKKVTMLISSHDLNHVTEVCERIALLEKGKIIKDLKNDPTTLVQLNEYFKIQGE